MTPETQQKLGTKWSSYEISNFKLSNKYCES